MWISDFEMIYFTSKIYRLINFEQTPDSFLSQQEGLFSSEKKRDIF